MPRAVMKRVTNPNEPSDAMYANARPIPPKCAATFMRPSHAERRPTSMRLISHARGRPTRTLITAQISPSCRLVTIAR